MPEPRGHGGAPLAGGRQAAEISVVLPTFNRLEALKANFDSVRALRGIREIVVVVDGSTDGTQLWLRGLSDERIRIIEQEQRGSPAARNRGVQAAACGWVLMIEDDCYLPADFALILLTVAQAREAHIVSAPWVALYADEDMDLAVRRRREQAQATIHLNTNPGVFPREDLCTPFLSGIILARREVLEVLRYNESLSGNAWREETSMFLAATEAGFRTALTPRTCSFQLGQWKGGQRRNRLLYEAWAFRNNWRFLRRHQQSLRALGEIRHPVTAQLGFIASRIRELLTGYLGARWQALARLRNARGRPAAG